jgi:predicted ATPase/DNA-binding SARP family transcriptional activator
MHTIRIGVLGPLTLAVDGHDVGVPGDKRRAVLARLTLARGAPVSTDDLIDTVWPDGPPLRAAGALQSHISRIRGHLGEAADRLVAGPQWYRLDLRPGELDVDIARAALAAARQHADSDPAGASQRLAAARDMWRGRPLAEFADVPAIRDRAVEFEQLRQSVDELLVHTAISSGDPDRALRDAARAAADDPWSEPAVRLHIDALASSGRHTDALRLAGELRQRLHDDLGLEPTHELIELEHELASAPSSRPQEGTSTFTPTSPTAGAIPLHVSRLIGRDAEVAAVRRLAGVERLVTIVGSGGVGKTRLAVEVARRHDDLVHFIALASLTDSEDLPRALAAALGLEAVRGDVLAACVRLVGAGPRLVVFDNCEHVLDRSRDVVTALLRGCPELTVLVTSRQRLGLPDECTFRLEPLALPQPASDHPERAPAMAVFLERIRRARPGFEPSTGDLAAGVEIVRRLDGVPLAIELAACRLTSLSMADLRDRLDRALDLLQGEATTADIRHRTLRSTLDWSYDLLSDDRRRLLRHLAVFPDGTDVATAERVAAEAGVDSDPAAALGDLVDASMLEAEIGDESRYRMLDVVRTYGLDRLDAAGERGAADDGLLAWAEGFTAWVDVTMRTSDEPLANRRLRQELANLRAAWALALRRGALDTAIAIVVALDEAAQWRDLPEVWSWAQVLAHEPGLADHRRRAAALATASDFAWLQGDLDAATTLADAALTCAGDDDALARALIASSVAHLSHGNYRAAARLALDSAGLTDRPANAQMVAALSTAYSGDLEQASMIRDAIRPPLGVTQQAQWEYTAAELANIAGRHRDAELHYRRAIELASAVGSSFVVGISAVGLSSVLRATGRHVEALRGYRGVLEYWQSAGNWIQVWTTLRNLSELLAVLGDSATAAVLLSSADHAPDAPSTGGAAWSAPALDHATIEIRRVSTLSRDEAVAVGLAAIDAQLGRAGANDTNNQLQPGDRDALRSQ